MYKRQIFTYGMPKGLDRLAAAGVKNVSLSNFDVLAEVAAEKGYIRPEQVERCLLYTSLRPHPHRPGRGV